MTAAATPRGRPQYAAPRDEIAPSASGGRKTSSRNQTATAGRASRRHPMRREVPLGTRRLEYSRKLRSKLAIRNNRDRRSRGPAAPHRPALVPLGTRKLELASTTTAVRLPRKTTPPHSLKPRAWEILPFQLIVETEYFPLKAWRAGFLAAFCDANPAKAPVGPLGTRKLELARQQATTALRGRRPN